MCTDGFVSVNVGYEGGEMMTKPPPLAASEWRSRVLGESPFRITHCRIGRMSMATRSNMPLAGKGKMIWATLLVNLCACGSS